MDLALSPDHSFDATQHRYAVGELHMAYTNKQYVVNVLQAAF